MSEANNSQSQMLAFPDGRQVEFALYGSPLESTGSFPAFFFHGYPGAHYEGQILDEAAKRHGLCLIAPTRPGMGRSTFVPGRSLLDWASDVISLADHLEINQFAAIGSSGGGPYVLSCWHKIPRSRLVAAALVCSLYPTYLGLKGMMLGPRLLLNVGPWAPWLVAAVLNWSMKPAAANRKNPEVFEKLVDWDMNHRPDFERAVYNTNAGGFRTYMIQSSREAIAGGAEGAGWEAKMYGSDWGFRLEDLDSGDRILMWHGELDVNVPIAMAEKASALIKGATLRRVPGNGHFGVAVHKADEIVKSLRELCTTEESTLG